MRLVGMRAAEEEVLEGPDAVSVVMSLRRIKWSAEECSPQIRTGRPSNQRSLDALVLLQRWLW
jgi:hypothetical protein